MQIPSNEFLCRWRLREILSSEHVKENSSEKSDQVQPDYLTIDSDNKNIINTKGGKTFSAARRGTEKPP